MHPDGFGKLGDGAYSKQSQGVRLSDASPADVRSRRDSRIKTIEADIALHEKKIEELKKELEEWKAL